MTATDRPAAGPLDEQEPTDEVGGAPSWPWIVGLLLTLVGLGVSINLVYAHYTSVSALGACPDTGIINCAKVTTSPYSHIFGLPVSVLGLAFFMAMVPMQLPVAWRSRWVPLRAGRLGATAVGVGMIFWLLYVELFRLDAICLYCTAVHVVTVLLFISTVLGTVSTSVYAEDG